MDRREAIRRTSLLLGFAVTGSAATAVLQGCAPSGKADWEPRFFSPMEAKQLTRVADIILPETDTPGALAVGVPGFVDQVVGTCYLPEEQDLIRRGLADLDKRAAEAEGAPFLSLGPDRQLELINQSVSEALSYIEPGRQTDPEETKKPPMAHILELVVLGYFNSEEIGEQVLAYDPIPQEYRGCTDLEPGQRSWSL